MKKIPQELRKCYLSQTPEMFLRILCSDLIGYISTIKLSAELISEMMIEEEDIENKDIADLLRTIISESTEALLLRDVISEYADKLHYEETRSDS
jgi:hypothetical protein